MIVHSIKSDCETFKHLWSGSQKGLICKNDKDYQPSDMVEVFEYEEGVKSGRYCLFEISHILLDINCSDGLKDDYCLISLKIVLQSNMPDDALETLISQGKELEFY